MTITSFKITNDKSGLTLNLSDAAAATNIYLWTDKTYKYENKKIDLSAKLNGAATQSISISLEDISLPYFDGVYFIEVIAPTETCTAITSDLTKYEECILDKVMKQEGCIPCGEEVDKELITTQVMLTNLQVAIKHGLIQEVLSLLKGLSKFCNNTCNNCGKYKNIVSNSYFTFNIITE